ncbi:hypothetical protein NFJ02_05g123240 [Pycnococcus provasolii]
MMRKTTTTLTANFPVEACTPTSGSFGDLPAKKRLKYASRADAAAQAPAPPLAMSMTTRVTKTATATTITTTKTTVHATTGLDALLVSASILDNPTSTLRFLQHQQQHHHHHHQQQQQQQGGAASAAAAAAAAAAAGA